MQDKSADRPDRILLIEDEEPVAQGIMFQLQHLGYRADLCRNGTLGLQAGLRQEHDIVVLDLILPDFDGLTLCRKLREEKIPTPIIITSARGSELDRITGLEAGADDYLSKPFALAELEARIRAVWRRTCSLNQHVLSHGPMRLDCETRELRLGEAVERLTGKEFELLHLFFQHPGRVLSRQGLLHRIWGSDNTNYSRNVDSHISRLRAKLQRLGGDPDWLESVYAIGFRLRRL